MFKNIRISAKMIVVGTLMMAIPFVILATIAITRSTQGLAKSASSQRRARASETAQIIDMDFAGELKLGPSVSTDSDISAAANAVYTTPAVGGTLAQKGSGKAT